MLESLEDRLWETMFRDGQRLLREGKHEQAPAPRKDEARGNGDSYDRSGELIKNKEEA